MHLVVSPMGPVFPIRAPSSCTLSESAHHSFPLVCGLLHGSGKYLSHSSQIYTFTALTFFFA